jgi:hypothetical protein
MAITDAQVDPEAPITSTLMYSLRDDPAALPISTFTNDSGYITGPTVAVDAVRSAVKTGSPREVTATATISDADASANYVEINFFCQRDDSGLDNVTGVVKIPTGSTTLYYQYTEVRGGTTWGGVCSTTTSGTEISPAGWALDITVTITSTTVAVRLRDGTGTWSGAAEMNLLVSVTS